mmetsp:Transcript_30001/g.99354  ORF Transcript_30001/g.99354 Transcript_30001/m.99354 type:complete len:83 (+) Transcript_30001:412-660(+)
MWSASRIVESRCAITMMVHVPCISFISLSRASCTSASFSASKALVASSNKRTRGRRTRARAMESLCFWPPLRSCPPSPIMVL